MVCKKNNYGTYLIEDFKIRKYINNTIKNSGIKNFNRKTI